MGWWPAPPVCAIDGGAGGELPGDGDRRPRDRSAVRDRVNLVVVVSRAREGGPSASGFDPAARRGAMGFFGASRSKPLAEG